MKGGWTHFAERWKTVLRPKKKNLLNFIVHCVFQPIEAGEDPMQKLMVHELCSVKGTIHGVSFGNLATRF